MIQLLTILGHPRTDSLSSEIERTYAAAAGACGARVERLRLSELDFDPVLHEGYRGEQPLEPDLVRAQESLVRAHHVAFFFPTWWASTPALLKGFLDRVMLPGFAFRYGEGGLGLPEKLLKGRSARVVTTMDSPRLWNAWAQGRALHHAFTRSTLGFVGFGPLRERVLYSARSQSRSDIARFLQRVARDAERDVREASRRTPRALPGAEERALAKAPRPR